MSFDNDNMGSPSLTLGGLPPVSFGGTGISDIASIISRLAESRYGLFGPLEQFAADVMRDVTSGGGQALRYLASPAIAGVKEQTPQVLRQLSDVLPRGGALAEAQGKAITGEQGAIADILSNLQRQLLGTSFETGLGLFPQLVAPLLGVGSLRVAQKGTKRGKK